MTLQVASVALAAALVVAPASLASQVEMVPADSVTSMAKPLPKQAVKKGRVWLVLVGGAAALFAATQVLENNEGLFPAISRANKAMRMTSRQEKKADDDFVASVNAQAAAAGSEPAIDASMTGEDERLQAAVLAGMSDSRKRMVEELGADFGMPDDEDTVATSTPAAVTPDAAEADATTSGTSASDGQQSDKPTSGGFKVISESEPVSSVSYGKSAAAPDESLDSLEAELSRRKANK